MLEHVDRVQIAVTDRAAAAQTFADIFDAETVEDDEVKALLSLAVTKESLRDFLVKNHGNISATGEPNLLLYGGWKYGEEWLEEVMGRL